MRKARTGHERLLLLDAPTSRALHDWLEVLHIGLGVIGSESRLLVGDRIGKTIAPNGSSKPLAA